MPPEYSLTDLAKIADVTPRTIRYYIEQGLLPSPTQVGPNARYTEAHLDRLRMIRKLQAAHLPLADIRGRLSGLGDDQIANISASVAPEQPAGSAIDYVRRLLGDAGVGDHVTPYRAMAPLAVAASPAFPRSQAPSPKPEPIEPDRSQWERISLHPDVELHIRRPLGRIKNKRVDRLISIARQLLEEE